MNSITKPKWVDNGEKVISVGKHGLVAHKAHNSPISGEPAQLVGTRRGTIKTFSAGSRRRLREMLMTQSVPNSVCFGITCTVPWLVSDNTNEHFAAVFKRFRMAFQYRFPRSACIYRVELQQRKAPHIHAVVYVSADDFGELIAHNRDYASRLTGAIVQQLWYNSVDCGDYKQLRSFHLHGVKVDDLTNKDSCALFRYLADHTSKHKQAQVGYQGRQWGVIGRANLSKEHFDGLGEFDSFLHQAIFFRTLARVNCWVKKDSRSPFGCWYKPNKRRSGVIFTRGGGDSVRRIFDYSRELAACKVSERIGKGV